MPWSARKYTPEQIKQKHYESCKKWAQKHPEKARERRRKFVSAHYDRLTDAKLRTMYGITLKFYRTECERLDNVCPVCQKRAKLVVDHDHQTMKFRGLLCRKCNTAIGLLGDAFHTVQRAAQYLEEIPC